MHFILILRRPQISTLFPYTTLFRSRLVDERYAERLCLFELRAGVGPDHHGRRDRKSTRLNSSHSSTSYAVFCLKKKKFNPKFLRRLPPALPAPCPVRI